MRGNGTIGAISLFAKAKNIIYLKQKRESVTEFCFRFTLSYVFIVGFAFVLQIHRAMPETEIPP